MTAATADPLVLARESQRRATRPEASVWVSASAGSGKTRVLTDRILSLLLDGNEPHKILCLTFTKAAAAEMANRLAERLAGWAIMDPADLESSLLELSGDLPSTERLQRARRLFAEVLDTAGGMKIQTIHAFCQALLARFPLEAGVAPNMQVMEEREAGELLDAARLRVLSEAGEGLLAEAMAELAAHAHELSFDELLRALIAERARLGQALRRLGGIEAAINELHRLLGAEPNEDPETLRRAGVTDGSFDRPGLRLFLDALKAGTETEGRKAALLEKWLAAPPEERLRRWSDYEALFLRKDGEVLARLLSKRAQESVPAALDAAQEEARRLQDLRGRVNATLVARANAALLRLGGAILEKYEGFKRARALFDYDDLILIARDLLTGEGAAAWVLYKLDGGVDHILIDEAQDTNPEQWQVIQALTGEFFAGEGARVDSRTLFVVGDAKQSIYSFQRADPATFAKMQAYFAEKVAAAEKRWETVSLEVSFRSTEAVLAMVDAVFASAEARQGVAFGETAISHTASRKGQPGLVELWPPLPPDEAPDVETWVPPLSDDPRVAPRTRLAHQVARRIAYWTIDSAGATDPECRLASAGRRIVPADVLILVRRRNAFVEEVVRELKVHGVPVAGVDRMILTEQLAVQDLVALGRAMLQPGDDLTLACVLKGPLFGFDEDDLFALAWGRAGSLWDALVARAREADPDSICATAWRELSELWSLADRMPPFEFFSEVLGPREGRRRILARLGAEAADPLEEFLALALSYERDAAPSLEGFLHWLNTGAQEVKRDMEHGLPAVRVMTVHGSKGLQAPIVILPDTLQGPPSPTGLLWPRECRGLPLWPVRTDYDGPLAAEARSQSRRLREEEYRRLLYVAMTRAQDRLYVCGWGGKRPPPGFAWHNLISDGFARLAEDGVETLALEDGETQPPTLAPRLRLASGMGGAGEDDEVGLDEAPSAMPKAPLPDWALQPAPCEPRPPSPLRPSRPAAPEASMLSPLMDAESRRFQRGLVIHRLLQNLPDLPEAERRAAARRYVVSMLSGQEPSMVDEIVGETMAVFENPTLPGLFDPRGQAEVPVVGLVEGPGGPLVVSGQVDRLIIGDTEILVLDFKTNRRPPRDQSGVPSLYVAQMAAYRAVLQRIYPGRRIRCFLFWTETLAAMELDDARLANALS